MRHSYIRGIGHPLDICPEPSLEQDGLLCYPPCRSGYNGVGPICWQECRNMTAIGFVCWDSGRIYLRDNYNRGIGLPRICSKPYEQNELELFAMKNVIKTIMVLVLFVGKIVPQVIHIHV